MSVSLVSTSSVRAVLGVSAKELPDSVLSDQIYATNLREDLLELNAQIISDFVTIGAVTSLSSKQQRFIDLIEAYSAYNVAQQCLGALPMFAPLTIKDEKAELTRNVNSYDKLKIDVGAALVTIRNRLLKAYADINASAPAPQPITRTFAVAVGLAVDPVLGA